MPNQSTPPPAGVDYRELVELERLARDAKMIADQVLELEDRLGALIGRLAFGDVDARPEAEAHARLPEMMKAFERLDADASTSG